MERDNSPVAIWITDTHLSEDTLEVNRNIFSQVFFLCREHGIKIIIHGGDVFTSRKGQPEVVLNCWKAILDEAAENEIKIYAIPGNHDKTDGNSKSSFLVAFDEHPAFKLLDEESILSFDNIAIHFIPYYDEALYRDKLDSIVKKLDHSVYNILATHITIEGVRAHSGIKVKNEISQSLFENFRHVLVGHYHNRQLLQDGRIIYTGSAYQANFGEDDQKGCVLIYDVAEGESCVEFIDLDFRKYITIDLLPEDIDKELVEKVELKNQEANIRLRIQGDIPEEKKPFVLQLQGSSKVDILKESYTPLDIAGTDNVALNSNDIMETYDQWSKERKIEDSEFGRQILTTKL